MANLAEHHADVRHVRPIQTDGSAHTNVSVTAPEEVFDTPGAATYVGMSPSWLAQTRMRGRTDGPPFILIGTRSIRYRRCDLDRWLERRVRGATVETQPKSGVIHKRPRAYSRSGILRKRKRPRNRASNWQR